MDRNKPNIVGPNGEPVHATPEITEEAIDKRIDLAIEKFKTEQNKKWGIIAVCVAILFGGSIATLVRSIPGAVKTELIEPKISASVNEIIEEKTSRYVDRRVRDFEKKVEPIDNSITLLKKRVPELEAKVSRAESATQAMKKELGVQQDQLSANQRALEIQVRIQELAISSKTGDRGAFAELQKISGTDGKASIAASTAIKEIELFYDADRSQIFFSRLVVKPFNSDPGLALEEIAPVLAHPDSKIREAAANSIASLNQKASIYLLCEALQNENNLRVVARLTRAISTVTNQEFKPLEKDVILDWWRVHKTDQEFAADWTLWRRYISSNSTGEEAVEILTRFVKTYPSATLARCILARELMDLDRDKEADDVLNEVQRDRPDYRWLFVLRARRLFGEGRTDSAVNLLNQILQRVPNSEAEIKSASFITPWVEGFGIEWPSEK